MRRLAVLLTTILLSLGFALPAAAGSPHFVGTPTFSIDGSSLTVEGKIAGLGNEDRVNVQVTADVECVNPGGNKPSADNKDEVAAEGDFPVQNGKALFSLTATASFQPECSPPMFVEFSNIVVTDTTHDISVTLS
jgi:hypothetical protein